MLTEEYDYDAYGILIEFRKRNVSTGMMESKPVGDLALHTHNRYLFAGEQWDADLGMYYNRARYLNTQTGRFHSMDTYEGRNGEPMTLHKYLYAHANGVSNVDPSGNFSISQQVAVNAVLGSLINIGFTAVSGIFTPGFYQQDLAELAKDFGVSAGVGAIGGAAGTGVSIWLKAKLLSASIRPVLATIGAGATGGAAAGFSAQLLAEIWSFVIEGTPVTYTNITNASKRVASYTFAGLITGGLTAKVNISRQVKVGYTIPAIEEGLVGIPFGGLSSYITKLNISGISGIGGSGLLGNFFAEYYDSIF